MKRLGRVIEDVAEYGNLAAAFHTAARGKRQQLAVQAFQKTLSVQLGELSREILSGKLTLGPFQRFTVRDPKVRVIHAAPFRERVLHHAIMNVVGHWFERGAISQSYACRPDKGNAAALAMALKKTTGHRYVLKLDVRRFFDSVDHAVLLNRLERLFKDRQLLDLFRQIVTSYHTERGRGLPIGTLTSQYFANAYLDPLDRWITAGLGCSDYVRFMDDFVLWSDSERVLEDALVAIEAWLRDELKLELKEGSRVTRTAAGWTFLGYRLKPGMILLSRPSRKRFRQRLREVEIAYGKGELSELERQRRVGALLAFTDKARCRAWRRVVVRSNALEFGVA